MAALGQTISGVAHELNNPLATILSWAERLAQRKDLDDAVRRGLDTILSESERAARIVRNLLTFARKRQTTRAMVDVNQVVRETLALRAYEQRVTNISVIDALAAGLPQVFADGHQIQQVLLNLIINAEQAMLVRQRPRHAGGSHLARRNHESVVLEINDDGPGIPDDVAAEDLRSVLHHERSRQGHGARTDRRLRDRPGTRRPDPAGVASQDRRVVLRGVAGQRRATAARRRRRAGGSIAPTKRSPARRSWSSRTKPSSPLR